ncbi:hypothetical protein NKDENANG_01253 [Candidatus Entotheonellaceae bacterium PAL068K]
MTVSHWPHPDAPMPGAVDAFLKHPLSAEAKRKSLRDHAVDLYGEKVVAEGAPGSSMVPEVRSGTSQI